MSKELLSEEQQDVCPRCLNVWANCPTWGRCLKPTDDCLRYAGEAMAREPVAYFFTNHPEVDP